MALLSSNNATRGINNAYLNITKRLAFCISLRLQDVVEYDKPINGYITALGEGNMKAIELTKDLSIHHFGIDLEVAPDEEEKSILEQNIQMSIAQKELRIEDAIMVRTIKNVKLANQMLILRRKKYQEELMKQMEAQQQAQAQAQQQAAAMSAQVKQQEVAMEAQAKQQEIQIKSQAEAQQLQLEYQLKEQFEQASHMRRIQELQASQGVVQGKEMQKENRKDMRNEVSDYNQSQMIEQRKNRRQPLDNPKGGPAI